MIVEFRIKFGGIWVNFGDAEGSLKILPIFKDPLELIMDLWLRFGAVRVLVGYLGIIFWDSSLHFGTVNIFWASFSDPSGFFGMLNNCFNVCSISILFLKDLSTRNPWGSSQNGPILRPDIQKIPNHPKSSRKIPNYASFLSTVNPT